VNTDQELTDKEQVEKAQYQKIFNQAAGVSLFLLDPEDFKADLRDKETEEPLG